LPGLRNSIAKRGRGAHLLQHALPMPFGLKLCGICRRLHCSRIRLRAASRRIVALQFGGAAARCRAWRQGKLLVAEN